MPDVARTGVPATDMPRVDDNLDSSAHGVKKARPRQALPCSICLEPLLADGGGGGSAHDSDNDDRDLSAAANADGLHQPRHTHNHYRDYTRARVAALFESDGRTRTCRHFFHADCIRQVRQKECPLCRRPFLRARSISPACVAEQRYATVVRLFIKLATLSSSQCDACGNNARPAVSLEFFHHCRTVFEGVLAVRTLRQLDTLRDRFSAQRCHWALGTRRATLPQVLQHRHEQQRPRHPTAVPVTAAKICLRNHACNDLLAGVFRPQSRLAVAVLRLRRWWAHCSWRQLGDAAWRAATVCAAGLGGSLCGALLGAGVSVLAAQVWRAGGIFLEHTTVLDHVQFGRVFHVALLVLALVQRLAALASSSSSTIAGARDSGVLRLWIRRVCVVAGLLGGARASILQYLGKRRRRRRAEWLLLQWRRGDFINGAPGAASPGAARFGLRHMDADDADDDTDLWWLPHVARPACGRPGDDAVHAELAFGPGQQKGVVPRVKGVALAFGEGAVAVYRSMCRRGATVHVAQRYRVLLTVLTTIAELM